MAIERPDRCTIADIPVDATLVDDIVEVREVMSHVGYDGDKEMRTAFVKQEGSQYTDVWATPKNTPWVDSRVYKVL